MRHPIYGYRQVVEVLFDRVPHDLQVNGQVSVGQDIPETSDLTPGDTRLGRFDLVTQALRGLRECLEVT